MSTRGCQPPQGTFLDPESWIPGCPFCSGLAWGRESGGRTPPCFLCRVCSWTLMEPGAGWSTAGQSWESWVFFPCSPDDALRSRGGGGVTTPPSRLPCRKMERMLLSHGHSPVCGIPVPQLLTLKQHMLVTGTHGEAWETGRAT